LWDWLQIHAIDAVSSESEADSKLTLFAKALGIPIVRGAQDEAALDDALASARIFAEDAR
jgi:hypothetical protein